MTRKKSSFQTKKRGKKAPIVKQKWASTASSGEKHQLNDSFETIFGHHSVFEALKNKARKHHALLTTANAARKLKEALPRLPLEPGIISAEQITKLTGQDAVHQGCLLQSSHLPEKQIEDVAGENLIVMLDQITDPHNIGAIMRSACAFGVKFMVMTDRHAPLHSMTLTKSASGAREHVSPVRVTNLARTIEEVKKMGFVVIGLDSEAETDLASARAKQIHLDTPTALVLGAEGKGLRRLTRENCDTLARISAPGPITSLNVSNAAALAFYELTRKAAESP